MLLQQREEPAGNISTLGSRVVGQDTAALRQVEDPVADLLRRHAEERRVRGIRTRRLRLWLVCALAPVWAFIIAASLHTHKWALLSLLSTAAVISVTVSASRKQQGMTRELAALDDVRVISPLVDAMDYGEEDTPEYILAALARLLPAMKASDAGLLTDRNREILRQVLAEQDEKKFTAVRIAILKALEQIGDSRDLKTVKSLAHPLLPMTSVKAVRDAARACLPYLETLAQEQRVRDSLLRPSYSIPMDPGALLRPAAAVPAEDPCTLLRAMVEQGTVGDPGLLQALLTDLARTGDNKALPYMTQIARMPGVDPSIQELAHRVAAEIELRGANDA